MILDIEMITSWVIKIQLYLNCYTFSTAFSVAKETLASLVPTWTAFRDLKNKDDCDKTIKSLICVLVFLSFS